MFTNSILYWLMRSDVESHITEPTFRGRNPTNPTPPQMASYFMSSNPWRGDMNTQANELSSEMENAPI